MDQLEAAAITDSNDPTFELLAAELEKLDLQIEFLMELTPEGRLRLIEKLQELKLH